MKKIREFLKKIFIDAYVYKETEMEKKSRELIEKILELPSTDKIMSSCYYVYLANDERKIYITFNRSNLSIINENDYIDMSCSAGFADTIQKVVDDFMIKSISQVESKMEQRKFDKITSITKSIKK